MRLELGCPHNDQKIKCTDPNIGGCKLKFYLKLLASGAPPKYIYELLEDYQNCPFIDAVTSDLINRGKIADLNYN